jgi:hypothetical protein
VVVQFVPALRAAAACGRSAVGNTLCKTAQQGANMSKPEQKRKVMDCRLYPSEKNCSLTISGTEEEVLNVAVRHAVQEHGHENSPQLRQELKALLKDE